MERIADQEQRQAAISAESAKYLAAHPQLKQLLHDFTTAVLASRPSDVHQFAHDYFAAFIPPPPPAPTDSANPSEDTSAGASAGINTPQEPEEE